jgi:acetyl-CoA acyltransferase
MNIPKSRAVVVDALRTPFVKSFGLFENEPALNLSVRLAQEIVNRTKLKASHIDQVIWGTVISTLPFHNIARDVVVFSGFPTHIPAHTVSKACISTLEAVQSAADAINAGRSHIVLTGGVEVMSRTPLTFSESARKFFVKLNRARTLGEKLALVKSAFKFSMLFPTPPALAESTTGLTMGDHAEIMAVKNNITREAQDTYTLESHKRAAESIKAGRMENEIVPFTARVEKTLVTVDADNILRPDISMDDLKKLKPVFDRKFGTLTAGNSTALTDGASAVLLASEDAAAKHKLPVMGRVVHSVTVSVDPNDELLIGPAYAIPKLLADVGLKTEDVEVYEIHEAFAAQLLSCTNKLNIPMERINIDGGSLAYGHPLAASGGRLIARGLRIAKRLGAKRVVISACAAGGQAQAILLETL